MVKNHQRFFNVMQVCLDAVTLSLAYFAAVLLSHSNISSSSVPQSGALWMVPLLLAAYHFMDAYSPMRRCSYRKVALIVTKAHLAGVFIVFAAAFLLKDQHHSRKIFLLFASVGLLSMLLERYVVRRTLRHLRQKGYNQKHILIIGAGPVAVDFARKVLSQSDFGYRVIGFLDDEASKGDLIEGKEVLGNCDALPFLLEDDSIDDVVLALTVNSYGRYGSIIETCEKFGVRARIIPDYCQFLPSGTPHMEAFDGIPMLSVRRVRLDEPFSRFLKRALDVVVSFTAIFLTAPIMIGIAIGIKLTSPGPLLFRQTRIGLNNRPFDIYKFRSMRIDTAKTASTMWTTAKDTRTTKFGQFLRKTSLDELPQFFNVLFSDMSVIGPRPERPFFVDQFKEEIPKYMVKHQVKPGITGWAQVNGWRGDTSIEKRIECDLYYIENWELVLDIKIMFLTVFKGMVNKNAY
jgi:Undecaprenyl-phosphate glucose phosphotransferase